jgi:hypothetical protein
MSTGHSTMDMVLVILVPLLLRQLLPLLQAAWEKYLKVRPRRSARHAPFCNPHSPTTVPSPRRPRERQQARCHAAAQATQARTSLSTPQVPHHPLAAARCCSLPTPSPPPQRADKGSGAHQRVVTYTQKHAQYSYSGDIDKEPPNHLLQAAILLYLNHTADLASKITHADVQLRRVKKDAGAATGAAAADWVSKGGGSSDDGGGGGGDDGASSSSSGDSWTSWCRPSGDELLDHLGVSLVPPEDTWVELEAGLRLKR